MDLIKMKALKDFDDQEGDIETGEEFLVNLERARVLEATGRAQRVPVGTPATPQPQYESFVLDPKAETKEPPPDRE